MTTFTNLGAIVRGELPDREALIDLREPAAPRPWTAAELDAGMNAVARGALRHGYARGDRVAILSDNRGEFLLAYAGLMRAGLVPVPINHRLARDTIRFILEDSAARAVIADQARVPLVPAGHDLWSLDGGAGPTLADLLDPGPVRGGPSGTGRAGQDPLHFGLDRASQGRPARSAGASSGPWATISPTVRAAGGAHRHRRADLSQERALLLDGGLGERLRDRLPAAVRGSELSRGGRPLPVYAVERHSHDVRADGSGAGTARHGST